MIFDCNVGREFLINHWNHRNHRSETATLFKPIPFLSLPNINTFGVIFTFSLFVRIERIAGKQGDKKNRVFFIIENSSSHTYTQAIQFSQWSSKNRTNTLLPTYCHFIFFCSVRLSIFVCSLRATGSNSHAFAGNANYSRQRWTVWHFRRSFFSCVPLFFELVNFSLISVISIASHASKNDKSRHFTIERKIKSEQPRIWIAHTAECEEMEINWTTSIATEFNRNAFDLFDSSTKTNQWANR